jgi:hypothetical protein
MSPESVNRIAMGTQSSPMSVVWCGLPHHTSTDASVPSPARASARFGACWFPRQVSHVRGRLVVAPSRPGSGRVGSRANSFPRVCAACPGYRGREVELGFVAGQRPLQGQGGVDELGLLWLVELALSTRRGLGGVPGRSGIEVWGASRWPAADISPGGRRGESAGRHGVCEQRPRPLPFVWYDLLALREPRCGRARAADARSPGGVAHGPGPPLIRQAAGAAFAGLSGSMARDGGGHLDGVGH